jgi:hypothetical protein
MTNRAPLTDEEIEAKLHDMMQQLAEARFARKAATEAGTEALRIAMTGPLAALMRMEKDRIANDATGPKD